MKPISAKLVPVAAALAIASALALSACVPQPTSTPTPTQEPQPAPPPPPAPMPPAAGPQPSFDNWMDTPQTPGDWSYLDGQTESRASYGEASRAPEFVLRCNKATRQVGLTRPGMAGGDLAMLIRTETANRTLTASQMPNSPFVGAWISANDRLLDAMAISKGRFAVETQGMNALYLPSWPEVTRVIEDCRS